MWPSWRLLKDKVAGRLMLILTVFSGLILVFMTVGLYQKSRPILAIKSLEHLLLSSSWHPMRGDFGFFPFIIGSLWVTVVAVIIAVPLCLLTAIYLSEYAHRRIREFARPLIDLLAGIPSVVFGVWGVLIIVPVIKDYIAPLSGSFSSGYCVLAAGIVLAIMIFPLIINVSVEVFATVPREVREASLALGATKWQTIKHAVIRKAFPGIVAAILLGLSRAFGETMAVLMVAGNVARVPHSVLDPSYPLAALIANNYGEMMSIPGYDSALMFAALILLSVVVVFNLLATVVLRGVERRLA